MKKLLHERLREHVGIYDDFIVGESKYIMLSDHESNAIADEIERFYIPRPRFEDGEPVQFGDGTEYHNKVEAMLFKADGSFETHQKMGDGCGTCVGIYDHDELVKRPKPKATLERIKDDATMNPREYYQKYIGKDVYCKDDEQVITAFVNDLLRRQREVLEGDK